MAAVAFQLTIAQETFTPAAAPQPAPAQPPADANEAQGAPTPEAIVPLATQVAEGQQAQQNANPGQNQLAAFFLADAVGFNPNPDAAAQDRPAAANTVAIQAQNTNGTAGQAVQTATANANPGAPAAVQTPAEELTQLDQTLQSIGVNPQGISLFSRMAMLLFANNPAALRLLIQNLQQATQGAGGTGQANAGAPNAPQAANNVAQNQPAPPGAIPEPVAQIPTGQPQQPVTPQFPQVTGQAVDSVPPNPFPPAQTAPNAPPLGAAVAAGADTSGTTTAASSAAVPAPTPQFAVFQLTFAAINEQLALQNNEAAAGDFGVNAPAQAVLNVSA